MFDIQLAAVAAARTPGDGVLACARLENAACAARLGHMADLLDAAHAADGSADREQWCFDNWAAVCAQIGAAHAITSGVANGFLTDAVVLRERLPRVADVFAAGDIGYRLVHQICSRTGLVRDSDSLAVLDAAVAEMVVSVGAMSKDQAERNIDALVLMLDPLALVRTQTKSRGHRVDVHVDDATGTAHLDADLAITDAQAFDRRADALARTVCDRDPRDLDARRAAAVGAMGFGWDRLPCLCGSPDDCEAAAKPSVGGIVVYMIARHDAIDAGTDAGPDGGPTDDPDGPDDTGGDPGPDGGPSEGPDDSPDDGPSDSPDGGPSEGSGGGASDAPKNLDDADEGADDDPGDECSQLEPDPAPDEVPGEAAAEPESGDVESDDAAAEFNTDAQAEAKRDTDGQAEAEPDADTVPKPPPAPPPDSPPIGDLTNQRRGLVSPAPPLLPKPWYTYSWSALTAALNAERGELCSARPGVILGGSVVPAPVVNQAAIHATIRTLIHPGHAPPEPRYRPSKALAEFVRCRDQTCRFPGCTRPATATDIDHTVPYPWGPTAASNLACLCREHHMLKTFWPGWSNRQDPDGTIVWTDPDGNTITTHPGSRLLFPELCDPTAEVVTRGVPPPKHAAGLTMPRRKTTRNRPAANASTTNANTTSPSSPNASAKASYRSDGRLGYRGSAVAGRSRVGQSLADGVVVELESRSLEGGRYRALTAEQALVGE